jgi:hypothetical protein
VAPRTTQKGGAEGTRTPDPDTASVLTRTSLVCYFTPNTLDELRRRLSVTLVVTCPYSTSCAPDVPHGNPYAGRDRTGGPIMSPK